MKAIKGVHHMAGAGLGTAFRHLRGLFGGGSAVALEDGQLLARYGLDGDEAAFEALILRHGPMVLATCRAVLGDEHDSEDAFQATFLVLAKKARSIRATDALAGWLHRVAYHASVRAGVERSRRRRKETEAAMARSDASRPDPPSEIAALVHEEIERLPENHRLPVVLCDLEGLTYEQAAEQLRWTVPTLRNRLARARQRLKDRLGRRGAIAPSLIAAPTNVPPTLLRAALSAATGGAASTGATSLAQILLKGMFMTRLKLLTTATLATLALASAGLFAIAGRPVVDPRPAEKPKPEALAELAPPVDPPDGLIVVRGIVVDPQGEPVAGAKVRAATREPLPEIVSGPDGRFRLNVPPPDPLAPAGQGAGYPRVAAWAPGFGLGWVKDAFESGPSGEVTIRLVEEGPPIEGRILDAEGRPVAGARVQVKGVWVADRTPFADWIARARAGSLSVPGTAKGLVTLATPIEAQTGADGRFTLTGIGRDRVATLIVSGPTIARTKLEVVTDGGPEFRASPEAVVVTSQAHRPVTILAAKFEAVVGASRPVEGLVLDKDTGRPIQGLRLQAAAFEPLSLDLEEVVVASTDAEGRYHLLGLPVAPSYPLIIDTPPGRLLPYHKSMVRTTLDPPAAGPVRLDVRLKRGVVVRGRVTDKTTGRPVTGQVTPFVFQNNPSLADFPGYAAPNGQKEIPRTGPDGRFEVVTPPGRGLIAFRADRDDYACALGAEAIAGYDPRSGRFSTRARTCLANAYNVLVGVDLDSKSETATVDLQVAPGRTVDVTVLDPEGQPIDGLMAVGTSPMLMIETRMPSNLKTRGLDPSRPRRVSVYHDGRKLVGSIWLKGGEVGPLTIRMVPWGTVIGRLVDLEGHPLASRLVQIITTNAPVRPEDEGPPRPASALAAPTTDQEGRFRIEGLIPGLNYAARPVDMTKPISNPPGFRDVVVAPGEVKDLGDLRPASSKKSEK